MKLKENVEPCHAKPFPVPCACESTLKMEVDGSCKMGALRKANHSQWASPSFVIPKKDKTVRFANDFRELNERVERTPFPIPKIQDMLLKLKGFTHATSLDLNMGHCHVKLHPESKKLCTLVFPWGKCETQVLPWDCAMDQTSFKKRCPCHFRS